MLGEAEAPAVVEDQVLGVAPRDGRLEERAQVRRAACVHLHAFAANVLLGEGEGRALGEELAGGLFEARGVGHAPTLLQPAAGWKASVTRKPPPSTFAPSTAAPMAWPSSFTSASPIPDPFALRVSSSCPR